MRTLKNKVVVITGASAGIGKAAAILFAREGAHVVIAARRADRLNAIKEEIESGGAKCMAVPTDVSDRNQIQRLLDAALEHFGRVDVWINNAGSGIVGSMEQTTLEEMERLMQVNYMSAYNGCHVALQQMRRQGSGHIQNVSSMVARFPLPLNAAYTATKYAMNGLTEALAVELEGSGITASLIMPNVTETEFTDAMVKKLPDSKSGHVGADSAEKVAARMVRCALRPRPHVMFIPFAPLTLALFDLFPSLWRFIARRYMKLRAGNQ